MDWLTTNWDLLAALGLGLLGGALYTLKKVAPYTKTTLDDKAASWLEKALVFLQPKP